MMEIPHTHAQLLVDRLKPDYSSRLTGEVHEFISSLQLQMTQEWQTTNGPLGGEEVEEVRKRLAGATRLRDDLNVVLASGLETRHIASMLGMPATYLVGIKPLPSLTEVDQIVYRASFDLDTVQAVLPSFAQLTNLNFQPTRVAK
jgi:hypothetical protein